MTIELENISVTENGREILRDLTLDLSTEGAYLVTGEPGSGKTTLLRVIMGLRRPDRGRIRLLGDYKYAWLACGAVFQEDRLIEALSAVSNVSVIRKLTSDKAAREELSGLLPAERLEIPVRELTASERRMVCIVRALSVPADILVMDEPFAGMSEDERTRALRYITEHRGSTPLVVAASDTAGMEGFRRVELSAAEAPGQDR